jgi:hypothetical protein
MSNYNILQIVDLISNIEQVQNLLDKNICSIQKDQLTKLLKILLILSNETKNETPINNIINVLNDVFKDGKIEIYEIPLLIKILNENIFKLNISNISSNDLSLLLKLLIIIFVELNILKLNSNDIKIINIIIDTSLELLNIQIHIPNKKDLNKCCLFYKLY